MNSKYLIILSIIGYGCWSFFLKLAVKHIHPFQIHIVNCCVGICLLPIYLHILNTKVSAQPFNITGVMWAMLATLSATMAGLAFIYGVKYSNNVATLYAISTTMPIVITLILTSIFFREQITMMKVIGMVLIIAGALVVGR
jgi:uncharacterized membrane protein